MPHEESTRDTHSPLRATYAESVEKTIESRRVVFVSGQVPTESDGTVPQDFDRQCRNAWTRLIGTLGGHGMTVDDIVKVTTFLRDRSDKTRNSEIRQEVLGDHLPALTVVMADLYEPEWLVEIEAIAVA